MWIQISMDITRKSFDDSVHKNSTDAKSVARQRFCLFKFKSMQFDWISCDFGQFGISYSSPLQWKPKKNTATKKVTNLCMHTPLTRIRHSIATDLSINNEHAAAISIQSIYYSEHCLIETKSPRQIVHISRLKSEFLQAS